MPETTGNNKDFETLVTAFELAARRLGYYEAGGIRTACLSRDYKREVPGLRERLVAWGEEKRAAIEEGLAERAELHAALGRAIAALELCGPGASRRQVDNQVSYARGQARAAMRGEE